MDIEELKSVWEEASLPVLALEDGAALRACYQNAAARRLCPDGILTRLGPQELQALAAARGEAEDRAGPLFCHVGGAVYAAAYLRWRGRTLLLFQDATAYYQTNQRALHDAILANQAKTSFLSEMSHDIRTPMGAIMGLTEIALSQPEMPLRVQECLEKIRVASGHMMSLLNEVLDMSRIESGKILIQPAPVSVADLLHEILIVVRPQADTAKLRFQLEMGDVAQERIVADGVRVKQICLNLLSNAVKYTPAGGEVTFSFSVQPEPRPGWVRLRLQVRDTGIGMSPEFLEKLFTPFEREEKSTVSKIQGTGLGMAITKSLVERMDGEIRVESRTGEGSCFTVSLPFASADGDGESFRLLEGRPVLLLEADERQGAQARQLLASLGLQVDWARDADGAVGFLNDADLAGRQYVALLTAETLPDVELMLFLPEVRRRIGRRFPILILSENDWSQTEYMFTQAGADGALSMPLFRSRVGAELCAWAGEGHAAQAAARSEAPQDFSRKRLLLVEDNELNREIAIELLGASGVRIDIAEDGQDAVDRFARSAPFYYDMVLMDIQMPRMNGLDATRAIRALDRPDAGLVPIVAMTANAFVEDVQDALAAGMNAHISKPLDMDKVFATIACFLGGRTS